MPEIIALPQRHWSPEARRLAEVISHAISESQAGGSRHPGFLFPGGGRRAQRVVLEILTATLVARSGVGLSREDDEARTAW